MTEIDKKYAEALVDDFTRFELMVHDTNNTDYITIVVEETDDDNGQKE